MTRTLTALLGIDAPILLGPFGGLSSIELTASVSAAGGLGSYGLYGYSPERIAEVARGLRAATERPFALNLWLRTGSERDATHDEFDAAVRAAAELFSEVQVVPPAEPPARYLPDLDEQLQAVLDARPAVVSFVYGVPDAAFVSEARTRGIRILGTATTVAEARALAQGGVDAIVATGAEAAGHRVSFLRPPEESLVGTFALVPQVVDAVDVPVIAAGGIADARGVRAALALGAAGVQVGTAFLHTRQSAATDGHRAAIRATAADESVLTTAMSGRLARGARNRAVRTLEAADAVAPFPAQNWITGRFRAEAGARGVSELQSLWLGQSAPLVRHDDARDLMDELRRGLPTVE